MPSSAYDFRIEGYCERTGKFLTTANVHNRLSSTRIVCTDGKSYELVGPFDRVSGAEGYIPERILDAFVHGVPRNWRQVIRGWLEQEDSNGRDCREAESTVKYPDLPFQRCSADKSFQKMQRDSAFNFQRRRRHSGVASASATSPTKQHSTRKSGVAIVGSYASPLYMKEAKIYVERLPEAILLETVNGAIAVGPTSSTPRHAPVSLEKTRNLSTSTRVSLSGKAKQKVPKKLGAEMGMSLRNSSSPATRARARDEVCTRSLRNSSCPATRDRARGASGARSDEVCTRSLRNSSCPATRAKAHDASGGHSDKVCTRSRSASAQRILRSAKQGMQATRDVNGKIKTASTCEMQVRKRSTSGSTGKKGTAFLKLDHVAALPVAERALSGPSPRKYRNQGQKKSTKQKDKPELSGSRTSSRGEQMHSNYGPVKERKSSTSVQTRIGCYPTRKNSELEVKVMSPCVLPDKSKSSVDSSRHRAGGMEQTGIQLRSDKCDILASRQHKATASLEECTSAIINKRYPVRSSKKASNTGLSSAKKKLDDLSSLSGCQNEAAKKNNIRPREDECGLSVNEHVRTRSGHCYQRKNVECKDKLGAKSLNMLPAKRKHSLDNVQRAASEEQQTGAPHSSRASCDNTFAKQKKAATSLREGSSTVKQQHLSHTTIEMDSAETIPVKLKSLRRKSPGSQKDPATKSSPHSEVQGKHRYSTRSCALALRKRAPKSSSGLLAKHKFNLETSQITASSKQQTGASRRNRTLSKELVTKQQKATENETHHSSCTVRTRRTSSTKFNTGQTGSPKTRRTPLPRKSATTSSHDTSKKTFGNVCQAKAASCTHRKIDTTSASGKQKSNMSSSRQDTATSQRRAPKRKRSVTCSSEFSPRKKTSRGDTSQRKGSAKVTSCSVSSRATAGKQKSSEGCIGQQDVCSENRGESSVKPLATPLHAILPKEAAVGDKSETDVAKNHSNTTGIKRGRPRKKQPSLEVHNNSDAQSRGQPSSEVANALKSVQTEQAGSESESTPKLSVSDALKKGCCEPAEPFVKPQPCKQGRSADSTSQTTKPKASESTEALLAITARKGTLKRKAQIKKLADALAAKEACDDIYQSQVLGGNIPGDFFMTENWDELSDFRASRMTTPVPNSPHLSPGKSQFSFSSVGSASSESPVAAVAIMKSIRKRDCATTLKSSTPKSKYMKKNPNVNVVLQGLRNLEAKLEKERLKENCEDSNEEVEDTDVESSQDDEHFFFH